MKAVIAILSVVALLGVVYGLAFAGIIPTQKMADKSPGLAHALTVLHLAKVKKPVRAILPNMATNPEKQALEGQKKQLAADRAQLEKDRADWEAQKQTAPSPPGDTPTPAPNNAAKLSAIYATMSADDIARVSGKLPDPDIIQTLTQLDEKKAGQVLAALPDDRAARLTRKMAHVNLANKASGAPASSARISL